MSCIKSGVDSYIFGGCNLIADRYTESCAACNSLVLYISFPCKHSRLILVSSNVCCFKEFLQTLFGVVQLIHQSLVEAVLLQRKQSVTYVLECYLCFGSIARYLWNLLPMFWIYSPFFFVGTYYNSTRDTQIFGHLSTLPANTHFFLLKWQEIVVTVM